MSAATRSPLLDQPLPDLALTSTTGGTVALRAHVGSGPQVYFFFIRAGTPT